MPHSDASEAQTQNPSVSSQALYHWATVLPIPPILCPEEFTICLDIKSAAFIQNALPVSHLLLSWWLKLQTLARLLLRDK